HRARRLAHPEKDAALDDAARMLVFFERDRCDRAEHAGDRGVVDEAVEPPPAVDRSVHRLREVAFDSYIHRQEHHVGAALVRERLAFRLLQIAREHAIAGCCERLDARRADAACAAGHQADAFAAHAFASRVWLICACATDARTSGISWSASGFIHCLRLSAASTYGASPARFLASRASTSALNAGITSDANSSSDSQICEWRLRPACCRKITWSTPASWKPSRCERMSCGVPIPELRVPSMFAATISSVRFPRFCR